MDGTRVYHAKQNMPVREKQISYDFTHMWNLRNTTTDEHRRREGKIRSKQRGRQTIRDS